MLTPPPPFPVTTGVVFANDQKRVHVLRNATLLFTNTLCQQAGCNGWLVDCMCFVELL